MPLGGAPDGMALAIAIMRHNDHILLSGKRSLLRHWPSADMRHTGTPSPSAPVSHTCPLFASSHYPPAVPTLLADDRRIPSRTHSGSHLSTYNRWLSPLFKAVIFSRTSSSVSPTFWASSGLVAIFCLIFSLASGVVSSRVWKKRANFAANILSRKAPAAFNNLATVPTTGIFLITSSCVAASMTASTFSNTASMR